MTGEVGYVIGERYRLVDQIGHGGMGRVWRAVDGQLGREVAVKEIALPPGLSPEERERYVTRMEKEARSAARLGHPNVITVHDVVHEGDVPWIVMELVVGESLDSLLNRTGRLPWEQAARIGTQIASALAHAHERQIVHRDLKPDNVLLAGTRVVLTDFGIARVMDETVRQTSVGAVIGTPHYMSPEQVQSLDIGPASDLWSLGVLLYAAVEGGLPFTSPPVYPLFTAILNQPAPLPQQAGPLTGLINQLLSKDPAQRPPAAQVADYLSTLGRGAAEPTPQPPLGPIPQQSYSQQSYVQQGQGQRGKRQQGQRQATAQQPGYYNQPTGWHPGYGPGVQGTWPGAYPPGPYSPPQQPWSMPGMGLIPGTVRFAHWGQRVAATLIDGVCLLPCYIGYIFFFASIKFTTDPETGLVTVSGPSSAGWASLAITAVLVFGFSLWQLYLQGTTGQTIGKRLVHIRVVREADGGYTGFGRAVLRYLAHIIDGLPLYLGYFAPLWDDKNQTFADKACHTIVIES